MDWIAGVRRRDVLPLLARQRIKMFRSGAMIQPVYRCSGQVGIGSGIVFLHAGKHDGLFQNRLSTDDRIHLFPAV